MMKRILNMFLLLGICCCAVALSAQPEKIILNEQFLTTRAVLEKWKHIHFRYPVRLKYTAVKHDNNYAACFLVPKTGMTLDTYFITLPIGIKCNKIRVSFLYNTTSAGMPMLVAVSGSRGCNIPAIKKHPELIKDGKWHECILTYDLSGFNLDKVDLEFLVEGKVKHNEKLMLDNIKVTKIPPPPFKISLNSPVSRSVIADTPGQNVVINVIAKNLKEPFSFELYNGDEKLKSAVLKPFTGKKTVTFDLTPYNTGTYIVKAGKGKEVIETWTINKYPYRENSLLIHNRIPYYNGKPFFPIGIYHSSDLVINIINNENQKGIAEGKLTREQMFHDLRERGFNVVNYSWRTAPKKFFKVAARYGFLVLSESRNQFEKVNKVKDQPNIFGWYSFDEPSASLSGKCSETYLRYKKIDPYHPVMTAFRSAGTGYGDVPLVDIAFSNRYPVNSKYSNVGGITEYLTRCRNTLNRNSPATCEMAVPQLFTHDSSMYGGVVPTIKQVRAEVYTSITAGAKGVFYYAYYTREPLKNGMPLNKKRKHWFLPESKLWNSIGALNKELIPLQDVILLGEDASGFKLSSSSSIASKMLKYQNNYYWIVVNPDGEQSAQITLQWNYHFKKIVPLFNSLPLEKNSNNHVVLTLPVYGVGIYKFLAE